MKTQKTLLIGLAGLGFVLALPAQATTSAYLEGSFMVARRDDGNSGFEPRRDSRDERSVKGNKKSQTRDAESYSEPDGYGYGYERRQQEQAPRDDGHRGRRR
ncbi:MAG: hypothetical protein ABL892_00705 [Thiobacillaceae bacterium]